MFKKNYNDAFDCIKPDPNLKEDILLKLETRETKKRNPAIPWRVGFAVAAAAAITLSVIFIPKNNINSPTTDEQPTLTATESYEEIYHMMSKYKTEKKFSNFWNGFYAKNSIAEDDMVVYEEYISDMDGAAMPESAIGGNTSANGVSVQSSTTSDKKGDSEDNRGNDYSETTTQVEGVKEADIVKTDGKNIYALYGSKIKIYSAKGKDTALIGTINLTDSEDKCAYGDMFLNGNLLTVMQTVWNDGQSEFASIIVYDIKNPEEPKEKYICRQQGYYNSSRMIGNFVYIITDHRLNTNDISREKPETYVPSVICKGETFTVPADSIYCYGDSISSAKYSVIGAYDVTKGELTSSVSLLGGTDNIYCSSNNIIIADSVYNGAVDKNTDKEMFNNIDTTVSRISIDGGNLKYKCSGTVGGSLENQFFIDEHKGYFRFVTTVEQITKKITKFDNSESEYVSYSNQSFARLTVLDGDLKEIGRLDNVAEGERVYSVRFMGDIGYFVTFRQTDPLFSVDLSDPKNPKLLGQLKIPGFSEYMYPYGDGLLLGFGMEADEKTGRTSYLKLSMFNTSNPADLTEQNKTVIDPFTYSEALYNHKAMLVSVSKNLIGFPANDNNGNQGYFVYEYTGDGFAKKAALELKVDYKYAYEPNIRGIFIGDYFYIVNGTALWCFDLNDFAQLALIK